MNAWFLRAMNDIEHAALELRTGQKTEAFLSCHRSIERVIKGLIVEGGERPPGDNHNLAALAGEEVTGEIPAGYRELASRIQGIKDSFDSPLTMLAPEKTLTIEQIADFLKQSEDFLRWAVEKSERN